MEFNRLDNYLEKLVVDKTVTVTKKTYAALQKNAKIKVITLEDIDDSLKFEVKTNPFFDDLLFFKIELGQDDIYHYLPIKSHNDAENYYLRLSQTSKVFQNIVKYLQEKIYVFYIKKEVACQSKKYPGTFYYKWSVFPLTSQKAGVSVVEEEVQTNQEQKNTQIVVDEEKRVVYSKIELEDDANSGGESYEKEGEEKRSV